MTTAPVQEKLRKNGAGLIEATPRPFHWTIESYHRAWDAGVFGHEAKLKLVLGRVIDRFADAGPSDYRWTADAFDRACYAGVSEEPSRLELIRGNIIDRMRQSPLHSTLAGQIADCLRALVPAGLTVREEKPTRIAFDGEPTPDVSVVTGGNLDYRQHHATPQDVAVLVEIAVSTEQGDLGEEALLYSQGGIANYWVVLPNENTITVHRSPIAEGYQQITRHGQDDTVSPLVRPDMSLPARSLLGL